MIAAALAVLVVWTATPPAGCEPLRSRILHRHISVSGRSGNAGDVPGTLEAAVTDMQAEAAGVGADLVRMTWQERRLIAGRGPAEYRVGGKVYVCEERD